MEAGVIEQLHPLLNNLDRGRGGLDPVRWMYCQVWPTRRHAQLAIFEFIAGWYNQHRLHSTLGYSTPPRSSGAPYLLPSRANEPLHRNGSSQGKETAHGKRKTYPRTAPLVLGRPGFENRGAYCGKIKDFAEKQAANEDPWIQSYQAWLRDGTPDFARLTAGRSLSQQLHTGLCQSQDSASHGMVAPLDQAARARPQFDFVLSSRGRSPGFHDQILAVCRARRLRPKGVEGGRDPDGDGSCRGWHGCFDRAAADDALAERRTGLSSPPRSGAAPGRDRGAASGFPLARAAVF